TLGRLKHITAQLGMIHDQNDTFALMDKEAYIEFVDQMDEAKTNNLKNEYLLLRSTYLEAHKKYQDALNRKKESIERIDFLSYQVKELEALNLKKQEKESLTEKVDKLKNFDRIKQNLNNAYDALQSDTFQLDYLYEAFKSMDKIKDLDHSYQTLAEELESAYYNLVEHQKDIKGLIGALDFDDETFNQYQERLFELAKF